MNAPFLLSSVVSPDALRDLTRRSDAVGLGWFARHLAAIAFMAALTLYARGSAWAWVAMAALGILEVALFAPLHETTHRTPFRSLWLNRAVGLLAGLVLVLPPEWFRLFHLAHHRHTQDPLNDPELVGARPLTPAAYVWRLSGLPYWSSQIRLLIQHAWGNASEVFVPPQRRELVIAEARIFAGIYLALVVLSLVAHSTVLVWLYLVPVLLGQPALRAVLMAEHGALPFIADPLANTRTTLASRAVSALFWNANFHAEHHAAPGVPFWALPRLHALLAASLDSVSNGYRAAHREIITSWRAPSRTAVGPTSR